MSKSRVAEAGDKNRSYLVIADTHSWPFFVCGASAPPDTPRSRPKASLKPASSIPRNKLPLKPITSSGRLEADPKEGPKLLECPSKSGAARLFDLIADLEQSCVAEVGDKNRSYLVIADTHSCPLLVCLFV